MSNLMIRAYNRAFPRPKTAAEGWSMRDDGYGRSRLRWDKFPKGKETFSLWGGSGGTPQRPAAVSRPFGQKEQRAG